MTTLLVGWSVMAPPAAATVVGDAPRLSPGFVRDLADRPAGAPYQAFVHFEGGTAAERRTFLLERGFQVVADLSSIDVAIASGRIRDWRGLASEPLVSYLEENARLTFAGDTGPWATRARVAHEPVAGGPFRDPAGNVVNGAGIGVAVVDSGVMSSHPDLANQVVGNYKWACAQVPVVGPIENPPEFQIDLPISRCHMSPVESDSDTSSGHGTHVAGIIAGDGTASRGTFRGVAPAAGLYGYGVGEYGTIFTAAAAFDHIVTNYDDPSVFPTRVRVVNNSWSRGLSYDPEDAVSKLTDRLIAKGVTVVFAAANNGGDGSAARTSGQCIAPTPGVICVANLDDGGSGNRNLGLATNSARGLLGHPETYPDIAAPGTMITSSCFPLVQPRCTFEHKWSPFYSTLSGTSMASPHVAGIAALLTQADPSLTPAEIEDVLQDTAFKPTFGGSYEADPQNSGGTTSFDKGAGVADTAAALRVLGIPEDGPGGGPFDVIDDATLDYPGAGSADVIGLTVAEEASGMRYDLEVRAPTAVVQSTTLRVHQNVEGVRYVTSIELSPGGPTIPARNPATNSAVAADVVVTGNVVSFLLPFAELGTPGDNAIAHNIQILTSSEGTQADMAPGGLSITSLRTPEFGDAYTIHPT